MWQDKIKEIIYLLDNSDVNEIDVTFWGRRFRVVKSAVSNNENEVPSKTESVSVNSPQIDTQKNEPLKSSSDENILSPMPGTFYTAPTPEAEAFVKSGDIISKGDTLCIIEAMKIMNEIESEMSGTVTEILINNADPVEYNQPLFVINQT